MLPRIQKAKYKIAGKLPNDYYLDISRLSISCAQKPLGACPLLVAPLAVSFQCLPSVPLLPTSSGLHWHSAPCFNSSTGSGLRLLWRWLAWQHCRSMPPGCEQTTCIASHCQSPLDSAIWPTINIYISSILVIIDSSISWQPDKNIIKFWSWLPHYKVGGLGGRVARFWFRLFIYL